MSLPFIKSNNGNFTVVANSKSFVVGNDHPNYNVLIDAIRSGDESKFLSNVDIPKMVAARSGGKVHVSGGSVFYGDKELHGLVVNTILDFINNRLPIQPLLNFVEKAMKNPLLAVYPNLLDDLYGFLMNEGLVVMENGNFLSHKVVRNDWMDIYTGTVCNKPGVEIPRMEYNEVESNPGKHCSKGYHAGAHSYVVTYANAPDNKFLLVEVDPADVVSIPHDGHLKLRCTYYKVVKEIPRDEIFVGKLYADSGDVYQSDDDDWSEDSWDDDDLYDDEEEVSEDDYDSEHELEYTQDDVDEIWDEAFEAGKKAAKADIKRATFTRDDLKKEKVRNLNSYKAKVQKRDSYGRFA